MHTSWWCDEEEQKQSDVRTLCGIWMVKLSAFVALRWWWWCDENVFLSKSSVHNFSDVRSCGDFNERKWKWKKTAKEKTTTGILTRFFFDSRPFSYPKHPHSRPTAGRRRLTDRRKCPFIKFQVQVFGRARLDQRRGGNRPIRGSGRTGHLLYLARLARLLGFAQIFASRSGRQEIASLFFRWSRIQLQLLRVSRSNTFVRDADVGRSFACIWPLKDTSAMTMRKPTEQLSAISVSEEQLCINLPCHCRAA